MSNDLVTYSMLILVIILIPIMSFQIVKMKHLIKTHTSVQTLLNQLIIRMEGREKTFKDLRDYLLNLLNEQQRDQKEYRQRFDEHQLKTLKMLQESLQSGMSEIRQQVAENLKSNIEMLGQKVEQLTRDTNERLKEINQQVDKRLADGFQKTNATFTDIIKRLAIIDEAQKKITELSSNVVSLQEVLSDKRSRGAFGEVQLNHLISNVLPEQSYAFQYTLSNDKRADAILFLPEPTGNIIIDAKFPLENYRRFTDIHLSDHERKLAEQQFRLDIKKHIQDIAEKYILPGETSDGAVMFIPAEGIFAEIHAHHADLIDFAHHSRVWIVSPTTLVAILNTVRAVLKDAATRKQIHIIQEHLVLLGKDFERFQKRIDNLAKHIEQAHLDVEQVHRSSKKITSRFTKIEKVELSEQNINLLEEPEEV